MELSEFDYRLPDELIAQEPLEDRAASRMLVLDRAKQTWEDRRFAELPEYLGEGDCLALNNSRVFPARLFGRKEGYARPIELLLLRPENGDRKIWRVLGKPGRHLVDGVTVEITPTLNAKVIGSSARGERLVRLECEGDLNAEIESVGHMPLPPYIHRQDDAHDRERYQTVYARKVGSVAAPTAGLHFTPEVLDRCRQKGASIAEVTLHVGLGTFQPLKSDEIEANQLHSEFYEIDEPNSALLRAAKRRIAVGTTSVRVMETGAKWNHLGAQSGQTNLFLYPGCQFRATDALVTNFHLPKSSLVLLVAAFAGKEFVLEAYRYAVSQRYRFFSYGDCMLIR